MRTTDITRKSRLRGTAVAAGAAVAAVLAATVFAGAGVAAGAAKPANTSLPTISGTAQEGKVLTGDKGAWNNSPTSFAYNWQRCNSGGGSCDDISGATSTTYTLVSADVGKTIRFKVKASNSDGSDTVKSAQTAVVKASAKPSNTAAPTITGTAQEGKALTGTVGTWTNSPTAFDDTWLRCGKSGGNCSPIGGAKSTTYTLTSADVGNTLRFRVTASNSEGNDTATSGHTDVVLKASTPAPPAPPRGAGCPSGNGNPDQVSNISSPARLIIDSLRSDPQVVGRNVDTLVVRFHVTSTCGGSVQGALVYATATPYNQFSIPPEATTGGDGWAELRFTRLAGYPVSSRQQLIAMFVRARKSGENLLAGISSRRLVSLRVNLHQ